MLLLTETFPLSPLGKKKNHTTVHILVLLFPYYSLGELLFDHYLVPKQLSYTTLAGNVNIVYNPIVVKQYIKSFV